jgi:hypothetical protein
MRNCAASARPIPIRPCRPKRGDELANERASAGGAARYRDRRRAAPCGRGRDHRLARRRERGALARAVAAQLYVFNDAGVGKDGAGIAALAELERDGIAAATVGHDSARIGEARDAFASGVVSQINASAARLLTLGRTLRAQLEALSSAGIVVDDSA